MTPEEPPQVLYTCRVAQDRTGQWVLHWYVNGLADGYRWFLGRDRRACLLEADRRGFTHVYLGASTRLVPLATALAH